MAHSVSVMEMAELNTAEPTRTIRRRAKPVLCNHSQIGTAQKMNINFWLSIFDVMGQITGVLPEGLGFYDPQFRNADGYVLTKINKPVQALVPILDMKNIDLPVWKEAPHPFSEIPCVFHSEDFLAVNLHTSGLDPILLDKSNQAILPCGQAFTGLLLSFARSEHEGKQATILDHVPVGSILGLNYVAVRQTEV